MDHNFATWPKSNWPKSSILNFFLGQSRFGQSRSNKAKVGLAKVGLSRHCSSQFLDNTAPFKHISLAPRKTPCQRTELDLQMVKVMGVERRCLECCQQGAHNRCLEQKHLETLGSLTAENRSVENKGGHRSLATRTTFRFGCAFNRAKRSKILCLHADVFLRHAPVQPLGCPSWSCVPAARMITILFVGWSWRERLFSAARRLSVCSGLIWPSSGRFFATKSGQVIRMAAHREVDRSLRQSLWNVSCHKTTSPRSCIQLLVPLSGSSVVASLEGTWTQVVSLWHPCSSQVGVLLEVHAPADRGPGHV